MTRRRDFLRGGLFAAAAPLAAKTSSPAGKTCVLLNLTGGPSHLDTWDPKPDAPSHIRGPFKAIRTNVPGIEISELFPRMARHADKYALIRSVHSNENPSHDTQLPDLDAQVITVNMYRSVFDEPTWDMHGWGPFSTTANYRDLIAPAFDAAFSDLLEDLQRRDLLESTLVVAMGEFGRTPKINPSGGRDHWPHCWTAIITGGGIQGGQAYGCSDSTGSYPRENPVTPANIAATIQHFLGNPQPGARPILELF